VLFRSTSHFGVAAVEGIGLETDEKTLAVAHALRYAGDECMLRLDHVKTIWSYSPSEFMVLDATTLRNLEVVRSIREGTSEGTLLSLMDRCSTAMGSRLLVNWLTQPLKEPGAISERLDAVQELIGAGIVMREVRELLRGMKDVDRLASRVGYGNASPRDLVALRDALERVPKLKVLISKLGCALIARVREMDDLQPLASEISKGIVETPPPKVEVGYIKTGYSKEIDELRQMTGDTRDWLSRMEETEKQKTGIRSLRIGFNKIFGYYIEVSKANLDKVPPYYIRKQTTVNAERFITPELKEVEERVANAEERLRVLESQALQGILSMARASLAQISRCSNTVACVDVLCAFAGIASENGYCRPEVNESRRIVIRNGRHPVVEHMVTAFVPNDADLDPEEHRVMVITGPNMAGKSTYMRQVALIVSMAQSGSFVPAEYASIGVVDRIFTRVGAFDDLVRGQSTFMTEMVEVASILHSATKDSLILLDEIGRGTSTYDGLSIAWAVVEHIADKKKCGARAMVATHYHQLTQIASKLKGVVNYQIAVKEDKGDIIFLRKVVPGSTDKSYGIHVARLAGLPAPVVESAKKVLANIESQDSIAIGREGGGKRPVPTQLMFMPNETEAQEEEHEALKHLRTIDPDRMTPMEALALIARLKKMVHEGDPK
jgi:DNA mismatch repair protein MutS